MERFGTHGAHCHKNHEQGHIIWATGPTSGGPSIMLMSSRKASSKSPFPEMRQKTLAPKHNLSIPQNVHHKGRGMRLRESGNSEGADDFVFWLKETIFFPVLISGRIFLSRSILSVKLT